jgi:GH15 family glucan-1,4-alpha-glucosidase
LPIQEDETALVLSALWNHFVLYRDIDFIKPLYRQLIKHTAGRTERASTKKQITGELQLGTKPLADRVQIRTG